MHLIFKIIYTCSPKNAYEPFIYILFYFSIMFLWKMDFFKYLNPVPLKHVVLKKVL